MKLIYRSFILYYWVYVNLVFAFQYRGKYTNELISGHLVIPRKVNHRGEHISHNLTHHHNEYDYHPHYHITIKNNETLHLELEPHNYLIGPALVIERHKRDLRTRRKPSKNIYCHYHGKVRGHTNSRVAISACNGIVGHIKTSNEEYYIEPSKDHEPSNVNEGHPHVVFHHAAVVNKKKRRNHQNNNNNSISSRRDKKNNNSANNSNNNNNNNNNNHHHQHQHHRRKKIKQRHTISNCGTKEPRRRTERKIEWQPQGKVIVQGGRKIRRHFNHKNNNIINGNRSSSSSSATSTSTIINPIRITETKMKTTIATMSPSSIYSSSYYNSSSGILYNNLSSSKIEGDKKLSKSKRRLKRSISSPRHVETLIVADPTMVSFHDDVETYLLTIMNMVSSLYKDPSIGNSIHIVVVKMIFLEEDELHPELNLTENAQYNLEMFCSWQYKLNSDNEKDPHHHDVAILITRKNICGKDCMTLGLANVGGMCKPRKSCSVNEDNGIVLSHTIAHELGHNFGAFHDTAKIGCHGRIGPIVHIMTPTFGADTVQVSWSNCSRKYITHFLDQGLGKCLDDAPSQIDYQYPELPPGAMYNAELQCRLQFNLTDDDIHVCSAPHEICSQLWCQVNGECVTNMRPTAPGTNCGKHKWCQNGKCVPIEDIPAPVDGGWGNWSDWSECSRTCGGGISIQIRMCDNPSPANGGSFCIGERKRYTICNKDPCPDGEPSFRATQCSQYNNETYMGEKYTWLPYFDRYNPCKLFCTDADDTVIANWADTAADGTPCKIGTKNMCIDGLCRKVSCDWIVDSNKTEDRCGVCGGSDENCEVIKEEFHANFNVSDGYVEITTIPSGSRHILIEEMTKSGTFLSIGKANSSEFYLNGDRLIAMPGEYIIAGAESLYDREDEKESIAIPGPIEHSITLYVIVRGVEKNEGIRYEFTPPAPKSTSIQTFSWKLGDWTACTATCGGGLQYRLPLCFQDGKLIVDEELCWVNAENSRPKQLLRECNQDPCPAHWWIGPWQLCPVTCKHKDGPEPMRKRSIMCLDHNDIVLPDNRCDDELKPVDTEPCSFNIPICNIDDDIEDTFNLI